MNGLPILDISGLCKSYGAVRAVDGPAGLFTRDPSFRVAA